tara:strand:+ start:2689 stop:2889 length:201 start_codon:yes stop_codon:yes gene_type:complete
MTEAKNKKEKAKRAKAWTTPAERKVFLRNIGAMGGTATGPEKRRGDAGYYAELAAMRKTRRGRYSK